MDSFIAWISAAASRSRQEEAGTTSIEYGLIGGLIFLVIAAGLQKFSTSMNGLYGVIEAVIVKN